MHPRYLFYAARNCAVGSLPVGVTLPNELQAFLKVCDYKFGEYMSVSKYIVFRNYLRWIGCLALVCMCDRLI